MTPESTKNKTLHLVGVVVVAVMIASVAMTGSAFAATQSNHQQASVHQTQTSAQANVAHVNYGDQLNVNHQSQAAAIFQNSEQTQKYAHWDAQDNYQSANIGQYQGSSQANVAFLNFGDQVNANDQLQLALIGQNSDQKQG